MSTAEEMDAGRKRRRDWANPGASSPQTKPDLSGQGSGIAAMKNGTNVIPFGPTGNTDVQCGGGGTGPTGNVWPTGNTGPTGAQPRPNASQAADDRGDSLRRPIPILPEFANFPAELTSLPNWVLWRYLPPKSHGGKWRKVPFQPNGKPADTTDRSTWSGFEECCAAYARVRFDGLGFVFDGEIGADGLCYCGVDFDGCIENGNIHSLARSRIKQLNTYTERSVSGTGVHCIARAKPLDRIVKFDGVEVYTSARYFTFTGRSFGQIKPAPTEISALVDEVRAKEAAAKQQQYDRSGLTGVQY